MQKKETNKRLDYVKTIHDDYNVVIARHKRFAWMDKSSDEFVYFIYITRKQKMFIEKNSAETREYNILCFNHMFTSFYHLMKAIYPILEEYILNSKKIVEIVMLSEKLNPNNLQASGE